MMSVCKAKKLRESGREQEREEEREREGEREGGSYPVFVNLKCPHFSL